MAAPNMVHKKRIIILFAITGILFVLLIFRVGWIQIIKAEEYSNRAIAQQTRDIPIPAKRGIIYDRNGKELAISATTYTVWVTPVEVAENGDADEIAQKLSDILGKDKAEINATITRQGGVTRVAKYVEKQEADKIRGEKLAGISIVEDVKRYYPFGSFASHILGHTTDDNKGLSGIEQKYDKYLSGIPGRMIKTTDVSGRQLQFGTEKYYSAVDGMNVVLTTDEVIQHFLEKALEASYNDTGSKRTMGIVMQPKTGDVLAMGIYPDYDLNNARTPLLEKDIAEYNKLEEKDRQEYWNQMWRNPLVSDTYEPGSTFKLITTSMALESGVTTPGDRFNCTGYYVVAKQRLKCWRWYNPHGAESLVEAVGNSCNPVFIQLGQRLGVERYYDYLEAFGFTEKTGIDFPGEATPILQSEENVGPVELATISYGQGISVTPLQLVTAISAIANEGKLMQPRLVKELKDSEGNVVEEFKPEVKRQVISKKTSEEMLAIMEHVVDEGGGTNAKVAGYRIGGKTGTADKVVNGRYAEGKTYGSFVCVAPIDDPQIAILFITDEPKDVHFGSLTAAPYVKTVLEETLRYLNVQPIYTPEEMVSIGKEMTTVPNVTNMEFSAAAAALQKSGLSYAVTPEPQEESFTVIDQYPKPQSSVKKESTVYLYYE